ncbi:unnamed protein product [Clonostachys rhizophaga]|uniref:Transcriptional regulator n=1 Tax=Clonostachys rhizophaga TaxID=160324 RepID=A0A9N9VEC8_9HYPO|nr:unnamed protein product [Clonostachys rhizophaga]
MYLREAHAEPVIRSLLEFVQKNPLGLLTTAIPSSSTHFIQTSHIPWVLDIISDDTNAPIKGRLRGHMAKQNPQAKAMIELLTAPDSPSTSRLQQEVQVLFTGSHNHYVTPKFYTETKPSTAKVVPTWNYAATQIYGKATVYHGSSPEASEYLSKQIHDLSQLCEMSIMGYTGKGDNPGPWKVTDAPERYIDIMKKNIVGIEVEIEDIGGKFKMSQEMGLGDRRGVIDGFNRLGTDTGKEIACLVEERGRMKDEAKKSKS